MLANSIGVYHGAPNVGAYFNTGSFINYDDYGTYQAMLDRIIELDRDDTQYARMLSEPFFSGNRVPEIIRNKERDLHRFLDGIFAGEPS